MFRLNYHQLSILALLSLCLGLLSCGGGDKQAGTIYSGTSTVSFKQKITLSSNTPATGNIFGNSIAFSPDGNTLLIGESNGNTNTIKNAGTAQLFKKTNSGWSYSQTLISESPGYGGYYGISVAFSSDGTSLAVGELFNGTGGTVSIYTQLNSEWVYLKSINSNDPTSGGLFGGVIAYSADGSVLAVSINDADVGTIQRAGTVQLFTKTNNWSWKQTLTADVPVANGLFGGSLTFSSDKTMLVVGESNGNSPDVSDVDTGAVHLFTNSGGNWVHAQVLYSSAPAYQNYFGANPYTTAFSPDSKTLAVGELAGDQNGVMDVGTVQLFTKTIKNQIVIWERDQILTANSPVTLFQFGASVSFSVDGKTLAVGEGSGGFDNFGAGSVQLFKKTGTQWQHTVRFNLNPPVYMNKFGSPVVYSPANNELAVGEPNGDLENTKDAGLVSIFDILEVP